MLRVRLVAFLWLAVAAPLAADSNLRIAEVGLHGYSGTPSVVRLMVRNPSSQAQSIQVSLTVGGNSGLVNKFTGDIRLAGGEQNLFEVPVLISPGENEVTAEAIASGSILGRDSFKGPINRKDVIALICDSDDACKAAQSQISFSGTIENRADKNRGLIFEVLDTLRDHWWAYSACKSVVLGVPMAKINSKQRYALEGYLRHGGRLVLLEHEIADADFLSAYRTGPRTTDGMRVGTGMLFLVPSLSANTLGDVFAGRNLAGMLDQTYVQFEWRPSNPEWLRRFAAAFDFPRLASVLLWLGCYIVIIGVLNFAVLRQLRKLELGWISMCGLAILFAAGFYFSNSRKRPREFRLDNLPTYYLDARSPLAAADYNLRISSPDRREIAVSISDPAVLTFTDYTGDEASSQIWSEMNQRVARVGHGHDVQLGPPLRLELSLLKWSFQDMTLQGLHEFPGTVHYVAGNRLRNDTGQRFDEAVYLDYPMNALYHLPAFDPGEEIQLGTIAPIPISVKDNLPAFWNRRDTEFTKQTLDDLVRKRSLPLPGHGKQFVGFSDGPALPADLDVRHQVQVHSLIIVALD